MASPIALHAGPISSASAQSIASESACSLGTPTSSTTSTQRLSFSSAELSTSACFTTATADAGNGSLHARSFASGIHNVILPPGSNERSPLMQARASAGLSERLIGTLSDPLSPDIATIVVPMSFSVSGTVSASASSDLSLITSAVDYTASVQGQTVSGSKLMQSSNTMGEPIVYSETGNWGIQTFLVLLSPNLLDYYLSMTINATARLDGRGSGFPVGATASADADIGHTLRWLGITGEITAVDKDGKRVALPTGLTIDMVGQDTGFNYRYAAIGPEATVPEPGTFALLLAGLGLVGWRARTGVPPAKAA